MKRAKATTEVSMREFRAAPAKVLSRAARTRARVRVGNFLLAVEEVDNPGGAGGLHGCMRATGRIVADPCELLSARDRWTTDA